MAVSPPIPKRTRYYGSRTSNPGTAGLDIGAWWYRSDLDVFAYWDGTFIGYWGSSGGLIAEGTTTTTYSNGADKGILVTIPGITKINYILHVRFHTDPAVDSGNPINEWIEGNVVGITLLDLGAGTTLTTTVTVRGW